MSDLSRRQSQQAVLMELGESVSKESTSRANKWSVSVVDVAQNNSHVCGCFGTHCLATVTAISHGRNLKPNPIRSGHYWEMSRRWSDGERGETDERRELAERGKTGRKWEETNRKWGRGDAGLVQETEKGWGESERRGWQAYVNLSAN